MMKDTFLTPLMLRVEGDNKRPPGANVERTSRPALFISISNTSFITTLLFGQVIKNIIFAS
jgi:hypothetical protein